MVPGSTLMYGSSLTIAILRPRASRIAPREAAAMPLPNEDTTPPVTNTKRVIKIFGGLPVAKESQEGLINDGRASYHNWRLPATLTGRGRSLFRRAGGEPNGSDGACRG